LGHGFAFKAGLRRAACERVEGRAFKKLGKALNEAAA